MILLLAAACATAPAPKDDAPSTTAPAVRPQGMHPTDVMIRPLGGLSCSPGGTAPLNLGIRITNRATESLMVRTIRLSTPVGQQIAFESKEHVVNGFLEGTQTDVFPVTVTATVAPECARPFRAKTILADIEFEARGVRFRETFELSDIAL